MKGVILAAGAGTRLNGMNGLRPKCLAEFGGTALIQLQLRVLRWCGIDNVTVVVGFESHKVRRACGPGVRFIENSIFRETNSLYSLWLSRQVLRGGFVVMNCDVLFHPTMLDDLLTARHPDALLLAYPEPDAAPFGEEEMKVRVRRGRVTQIAKDLPFEETDGENVGIVKFSAAGTERLVTVMDRLIDTGARRAWAPRAFAEFARHDPLHAVGTRGLPWIEIDTPEDYRRATDVVFPELRQALDDAAPALRLGA